jgi:hypothetical protein
LRPLPLSIEDQIFVAFQPVAVSYLAFGDLVTFLAEDPIGDGSFAFMMQLFGFKDEIQINPGSDAGELKLNSEGISSVLRQPDQQLSISLHPDLTKECLFFPIKSPCKEGTYRLRCNIYYENILIQSRLIHATVRINPTDNNTNVLRFDLEYALSSSLWPKHLTKMRPHKLSLLLNSNGDGTHKLMFVGGTSKESFEHTAMIDSANLSGAVKNARMALGRAS